MRILMGISLSLALAFASHAQAQTSDSTKLIAIQAAQIEALKLKLAAQQAQADNSNVRLFWQSLIFSHMQSSSNGGCNATGPNTSFRIFSNGKLDAPLFSAPSNNSAPSTLYREFTDKLGYFPVIEVNCGYSTAISWRKSIPQYHARIYVRNDFSIE